MTLLTVLVYQITIKQDFFMITQIAQEIRMSIFILDPQGEFSLEFSSNENLKQIIEKEIGREIKIYTIQNPTICVHLRNLWFHYVADSEHN